MPVIDFDPPDRFVAGTVGPPGQRTFFLQASEGPRVTSVVAEKQQVVVLADRVNDLLDHFAGGEAADDVAAEVEDNAPLDTPIEDEFRVRHDEPGLGRRAAAVVILECHDGDGDGRARRGGDPVIVEDEDADATARSSGSSSAPARPARSPAAPALVSAGRPPCPFCGGPLDPTGHVCPRANGYKR